MWLNLCYLYFVFSGVFVVVFLCFVVFYTCVLLFVLLLLFFLLCICVLLFCVAFVVFVLLSVYACLAMMHVHVCFVFCCCGTRFACRWYFDCYVFVDVSLLCLCLLCYVCQVCFVCVLLWFSVVVLWFSCTCLFVSRPFFGYRPCSLMYVITLIWCRYLFVVV